MTDKSLGELFDDAVRDQPDGPPLESVVDADLARGHRRRRRQRRRAVGSVGAAAVVAAVSAVMPSLLADENPNTGPTDRIENSDLAEGLEQVVVDSLPEDISFLGPRDHPRNRETVRTFALERGETEFELTVVVDAARPYVEPYDLCADPSVTELGLYAPSTCSAGRDEQGRWQIVATDAESFLPDLVVLESQEAAAMVSSRQLGSLESPLSETEALAVTEAVLGMAEQRPEVELVNGIDRDSLEDVQNEIASAVGQVLEIPLAVEGPQEPVEAQNPWAFTYRLTLQGQDGVEVDVEVWQRARMYEVYCLSDPRTDGRTCGMIGSELTTNSMNSRMWGTRVGPRGGMTISVDNPRDVGDPSLIDIDAIALIIPMLDDSMPDENDDEATPAR